jgi:Tfp pilus assembly protein PilF
MLEPPEDLPDDQIEVWQQALEYFQRGYRMQMQGDLATAIQDYRHSLRLFPTAEAHTFLGWAYAGLHLFDAAIAECEAAIALAPDLGNPYNDIGAYLIELGRPLEAIPWLEQAIAAPRYEMRAYAFFNLGRAYERTGAWLRAIDCFQQAVTLHPDYHPARGALQVMLGRLN